MNIVSIDGGQSSFASGKIQRDKIVQSNPVFVVGPSRSGTTMLKRALSLHSRIHISEETHWFDDLRSRCSNGIFTTFERQQIQDWFLALSHRPFGYAGVPGQGWLSRDEVEQAALQLSGIDSKSGVVNCDSYFAAFCKLDAMRHNKTRWGEKTPRHVFRIFDIHQSFAGAKVICILRDPRAMVASYSKWNKRVNEVGDDNSPEQRREYNRSRASYHPVIMALMWRGAARASMKAHQKLGENVVRVVRYEDLVGQAEQCLSDITDWLGEKFESEMLDIPMANSSFNGYQSSVGFSSSTSDHWQDTLSKTELAVINLLCRKEKKEHNYRQISKKELNSRWLNIVFATPHFLTLPLALWRAIRANQDRTGRLISYVWRRISP